MKHSRSKNAVLLMIIFICSICLNNVWARETGTMDQLEKENPDDVDKMNKVLYYYNTLFFEAAEEASVTELFLKLRDIKDTKDDNYLFMNEVQKLTEKIILRLQELQMKMR